MECNGQSVLRTDYPLLFNYFNTQYNTDDVSDVNRKTLLQVYGYSDTTHFNLPDYREVALVGIGTNGTDNVINHDSYSLGEFHNDCLQDHNHPYGAIALAPSNQYTTVQQGNGIYCSAQQLTGGGVYSGRSGTVTRGKRKGVVYLIKVL